MKYLLTFIAIAALANIHVSHKIIKNKAYDSKQKSLQHILVWIIPIFGALIVYYVMKNDDNPRDPNEPRLVAELGMVCRAGFSNP